MSESSSTSTGTDRGPPQGGASVERAALAAARRLRAGATIRAREPELLQAGRIRSLIEAVLESVRRDSLSPVEECLEPQAATRARQGYRPSDLLAEFAEVERALGQLVEGGTPDRPGVDLWRGVQTVLGHAERYLLREVEVWLEKHRDGSRRRMIALIEALPEAVLLVDTEGYVEYANGRVSAAFGVEPAEITGLRLADALSRPGVVGSVECPGHFVAETLKGLDAGVEGHVDVFRHENGATFVRRVVPVGEAGELGRAVITTNVTGLRTRNREAEVMAAELPSPGLPAAPEAPRRPALSLIRDGAQRA